MQKSEIERLEIELFDAKKAVRELSLKIEETKLRSTGLQRKPKWRQEEEQEPTNEDVRYTEVMNELERMKQELSKLKIDMARVLKEKRKAERSSKASSSKTTSLLASMELMKKELQELDDEQAVIDFARIEDVKVCEFGEFESNELQLTVSEVGFVNNDEKSPMNVITEELDGAKRELESVKGERFKFMTSMDVIRDELKRVRDETERLKKAEQKRELTVQTLNSKILRAKAKLETVKSAELKTNTVAANLAVTLEQLRLEAETVKKEKEIVDEEIENMNVEARKTEHEMDVVEERLEAAMEELKVMKSSEAKALGNLRNLINKTVEARDMGSVNSSMITITRFEYEYLTGKAGRAAELADKKIAAAQAWVEALKASERELVMKTEMAQQEIEGLSIDQIGTEANEDGLRPALRGKVVATPRRSMGKVVKKVSVKRARFQKLQSPGGRYSSKSGSMHREKMLPKLTRLFSKNVAMDERVI